MKQLIFEIYIILCQYSYHSFLKVSKYKTKVGEINILDFNFLLFLSYWKCEAWKYTTLNMARLLQLIG